MNILKTLRTSALAAVTAFSATAALAGAAPKPLQHVFYIMMENHGYSQIIGNTADAPFINSLPAQGALATNYFGVTHPRTKLAIKVRKIIGRVTVERVLIATGAKQLVRPTA